MFRRLATAAVGALTFAIVVTSCGNESESAGPAPETLTLMTHDSFLVGEGAFDAFTAETGITVEVLNGGDAGELVATASLAVDDPQADVLFGVDNTFLQRALDSEIFAPHAPPEGIDLAPEVGKAADTDQVVPIDFGYVCVNYWVDALDGDAPVSLDDLRPLADQFVTQNPDTSSPGLAFLLATIAAYGDDWEQYWTDLVAGGVEVTAGWSDAYSGSFIAGGGDRALVTSYSTSPVAEVLFSETPIDVAPTGVMADSCFLQVEYAGVLAGTEYPEYAGQLVDYMLSPEFQSEIPLNMFVYPANSIVELPEVFVQHAVEVQDPWVLPPDEIEKNRADWTQRWTEIVLS